MSPSPCILGGFRTIYGAKLAAARLKAEGVPPSRVSVAAPAFKHPLWPAAGLRLPSSSGIGALLSVSSPDPATQNLAQRTLEDSGAVLLRQVEAANPNELPDSAPFLSC